MKMRISRDLRGRVGVEENMSSRLARRSSSSRKRTFLLFFGCFIVIG